MPVVDGRIALDNLAEHNELLVRGRGDYSTSGEGLHRAVDPADDAVYVYSMCFLHDASRVFACFDQPDLKAVFRLQITAPSGWTVISNAPAAGDGNFEPTPRLPTYLVALAAGPYASVHGTWTPSDGGAEVPLGVYGRASLAPYLEPDILQTTKAGLDFYTSQFGTAFPFAKFDQLFAPEFNAGAMENAGLVIHMDELLFRSVVTESERETRANIVLHEMAHMWFGDLVTMRWWDDLWLNEAFATYCSYLATAEITEFTQAWTSFCVNEKTRGRAGDARPSSHPVSGDVVDTDAALLNFDAISYNKGASLLRQLVEKVGRDAFFAGVRDYFEEFAWGNTDLGGLLDALSRASDVSLDGWADRYLKTVGCSTLSAEVVVDTATGLIGNFAVSQRDVVTDQHLGIGFYTLDSGDLGRIVRHDITLTKDQTSVPAAVGSPMPDVVLLNDGDGAYTSIELDPVSLTNIMSAGVSAFHESLPRALVWGSLWDMTLSGEVTAAEFIDQVARALLGESHVPVIEQVLERARIASECFVRPDATAALRTLLAHACVAAGRDAVPGSGRQLALMQGEADFATSDEQLGRIADLLDGASERNGLLIDADLRWRLLHRLVVTGRRSVVDINAEFERDSTAFGRNRANRARAAVPSAEAKEQAWAAATGAASGSTNRTVLEACIGFWQWNQRDLTQPYVSRYFEALDEVWRERDTEIAHQMTGELFPALFVEESTRELVDRHLARSDLPAGQRRILADARFDLVRALDARNRGL